MQTKKRRANFTLKALGKEIAQHSTVNHANTLAVSESLNQLLVKHLAKGRIVPFRDFSSFQVTIGSSEAEFSHSLIKGEKVQFQPGTDLKDMLKTLKFERL